MRERAIARARRALRAVQDRASSTIPSHTAGPSLRPRELLAPIYGWFSEGLNTRELREAKALLSALS